MIAAIESLATIVGDALSAFGSALRTRREGFSEYEAGAFLLGGDCSLGRMESDGPDASSPAPILPADVRVELAELPDSQLIDLAAHIIAGWTPLLLRTTGDLTDVDVFVATLRDRAAQFAAVEADLDRPFLTAVHLTNSAQSRPE